MKGYVQYTLLTIGYVTTQMLIDAGVYPDPKYENPVAAYADQNYKPSDDGCDWEDIKDSYVFKITKDDAAMLAEEVTLPTIQFVLERIAAGEFPSLQQSKAFLENRTDISFGSKVPHNATSRRSVQFKDLSDEGGIEMTADSAQVDLNDIDELDDNYMPNEYEAKMKSIYGFKRPPIISSRVYPSVKI